ncbi:MAG: nucleotidyltransferase domain-containing protein [Candidatus Tectomicrobia bacterium]|uniref:Nucleotidyltransferase domain-containing protein n=1 Tax=Tectimicrobiota bacterium TaxID=2528274 RepID=A0A933LP43_UNCTE|nr:nucleotidyltransferase domain-containing protein [Candidatus Tectomicrobia bacterium]
MNKVDEEILDKFKSLLLRKVQLHRLILFGSRSRGNADRYSDMDVVVILEDSPDENAKNNISDCAWEAGFEHGIVIVPVVFSRNEWESGPERYSLLAQSVEAEGISL